MSGQVQRQVDVGAITLQSLAAFSPILAAISADNVSSTAVLQLENLGSLFPTNGPIALKVPDLLQRSTSTRLERVGLVVGWRNGDTSSLMAQSAAGQSISLLSACLVGLFGCDATGEILQGLSSTLFPVSLSISSVSQLARVSEVLHTKLNPLGFGNLLAQHFMKFSRVFEMLGYVSSRIFADEVTSDTVLALLLVIGQVLREDQKIIRITGFHSMGYVTWLALTLFPYDTTVVVDSLITHEGPRQKLLIVIDSKKEASHFTTSVEKILGSAIIEDLLNDPPLGNLLPKIHFMSVGTCSLNFSWKGWLADSMRLEISQLGFGLPNGFIEACSNLFAFTANTLTNNREAWADSNRSSNHDQEAWTDPDYPSNLDLSLFEHHIRENTERICHDLFLSNVFLNRLELTGILRELNEIISQLTTKSPCHKNVYNHNVPMKGWPSNSLILSGYQKLEPGREPESLCIHERLWEIVWTAVENGVLSLFIDAGPSTVVPHRKLRTRLRHRNYLIRIDNVAGGLHSLTWKIRHCINDLFQIEEMLARTWSSSTIYPKCLRTLQVPENGNFFYELVDGKLTFKNRYFDRLSPSLDIPEHYSSTPLSEGSQIAPSNIGQHTNLQFTIREKSDRLELVTNARYGGLIIDVNIARIIEESMVVHYTMPCEHPYNRQFESKNFSSKISTVSIIPPFVEPGELAIALVKGNPTAQLLCCGHGKTRIMMRDCCLSCAVDQAKKGGYEVIIVC